MLRIDNVVAMNSVYGTTNIIKVNPLLQLKLIYPTGLLLRPNPKPYEDAYTLTLPLVSSPMNK